MDQVLDLELMTTMDQDLDLAPMTTMDQDLDLDPMTMVLVLDLLITMTTMEQVDLDQEIMLHMENKLDYTFLA